jgi:hypothetical protein
MFNALAVSMRELELESAELLPSRETLCVTRWHHGSGHGYSDGGHSHGHSGHGYGHSGHSHGDHRYGDPRGCDDGYGYGDGNGCGYGDGNGWGYGDGNGWGYGDGCN